jgi:flavin reductase (DIM6/NTAB) family NADH-FMN oxidoreductase RutF
MTVDAALFRQVMSRWASGVTVVTTVVDGQPHGLTVSAFSSLSLDPPLALVCLDNRSPMIGLVRQSGLFAINILAGDQEALSRHFASREKADWSGIDHQLGPLGLPLLGGALASMECRVAEDLPGGDHTIFVGALEHAAAAETAPLVYYRAGYHSLTDL